MPEINKILVDEIKEFISSKVRFDFYDLRQQFIEFVYKYGKPTKGSYIDEKFRKHVADNLLKDEGSFTLYPEIEEYLVERELEKIVQHLLTEVEKNNANKA